LNWTLFAVVALFLIGVTLVLAAVVISGGRGRNAIDEDYWRKHPPVRPEDGDR
jgi:hypothetical protein